MPSETDSLCWADVDWEARRLTVRSPKTERFEGKDRRVTPITPRLMELLQAAFDVAPEVNPKNPVEGEGRIVTVSKNNRRRVLQEIIRRAGVQRWPDLFHALRRSCASDWAKVLPGHAVAKFLGHSEAVSRAHYLKVDGDLYAALSNPDRAGESALHTGAAQPAPDGHESAATRSHTESHGVRAATPGGATNPREMELFPTKHYANATGPGRTRTDNLEIMSPLL